MRPCLVLGWPRSLNRSAPHSQQGGKGRLPFQPITGLPSNEELLCKLNSIQLTRVNKDTTIGTVKASLPPSPLTDPCLNEARFGHQKTKPGPTALVLAEFQTRLRKNVYAQALATPVRTEILTQTRLPLFFLNRFKVTINPSTGAPWHLPEDAHSYSYIEDRQSPRRRNNTDAEEPSALNGDMGVAKSQSSEYRTLAGTWFLSSTDAIDYMTRLSRKRYMSLIAMRWKNTANLDISKLVWREDMPDFVQGVMRNKLMVLLMDLFDKGTLYWSPQQSPDALSHGKQVAAVCSFGADLPDTQTESEPNLTERGERIAVVRGRRVPLYNLEVLLGKEKLSQLREKYPRALDGTYAMIKDKKSTLSVQMCLLKLSLYSA